MTPFLRPRPITDPRVRLVVFHHAGGSGSTFYPLIKRLPVDWDVLLFDLPGRGRRHGEPAIERMDVLVAQVRKDLADWCEDVPLALFGHSLGAIVASELARTLAGEGTEPVWLGVSGRQAPTLPPRRTGLHLLSDEDLLAQLADLGGTPGQLLKEPDFVKMLLGYTRADFAAVDSFNPVANRTPLNCPIDAYAANADPWALPPTMAAWEAETSADFSLHRLHGGHFYFMQDQFAALAERLDFDLSDACDAAYPAPRSLRA
ncbi:MAG: alpha/beta fold hydrolase [Pseudomonadota bacterium]